MSIIIPSFEKQTKRLSNSVLCLSCNTILISKHRHDFVMCSCANQTFTDGGLDYQRIGGVDLNLVKDLSEFKEIKNNE